jgi:uncharacterized protein YaeQ
MHVTTLTRVQVVSFFRRPLFRASHASNPTMTDRERLLEAEVAWLQYGSERMNLVLRERNTVSNDDESDAETASSRDLIKHHGQPDERHIAP